LPTGHSQTKQQYPQKQISPKPITHPATNQPQSTMPTIANQQHSIQPPTEQTAAIEASNFGRSMNPDCFFEISQLFGTVRF